MDLESPLGDHGTARVALAVGPLVEFRECPLDLLGLAEQLLVRSDLSDSLDGKARAITDPLAEGDAAGGIGRSGEVVHPRLDVALLLEQHLARVSRHAPSVPIEPGASLLVPTYPAEITV